MLLLLTSFSAPTGAANTDSEQSSLSQMVAKCQDAAASPADREQACSGLLKASALTSKQAALAHYFRAAAIDDNNREEEAIEDLDAAINLDPELWPAYGLRAMFRAWMRQYDGAAADLTKMISQKPKVAGLYARRGSYLMEAGQPTQAIADLNLAMTLAGSHDISRSLYEWRASAYELAHQWDKALADYDESINRTGDAEATYNAYTGRGRVELLSGRLDAAITDLTKAEGLSQETDQYHLLWLYIAEARLGKPAQRNLRDRLPFVDTTLWPGPILRLYAGELTLDQITLPVGKQPWIRAQAECELAFFRGELQLLQGNKNEAAREFQKALDTKITEYFEYGAARAELDALSQ